jgi:GNAT superfamily N-acetyltransferase
MSAPVQIRPACHIDAHSIAEVHVASWQAAYKGILTQTFLSELSPAAFSTRWSEWLAREELVIQVATRNGEVLGFASAGAARATLPTLDAELYTLYLHPSSVREGIGSQLFWAVAQQLVRAGYTSLGVWVLERNPACHFYQRMGGTLLTSRPIEVGGITLTELAYSWPSLAHAVPAPLSHP